MIYQACVVTDISTPAESPKETPLYVTKGLVYKVELFFPPGSCGYLGVSIWDGGYQVWPATNNQWFRGAQVLLSYEDLYLKEVAPYEFRVKTYNEDDSYVHEVYVRICMVSKEAYRARFLPTETWESFRLMLESVAEEQRSARERERERVLSEMELWPVPEAEGE